MRSTRSADKAGQGGVRCLGPMEESQGIRRRGSLLHSVDLRGMAINGEANYNRPNQLKQ